MINVVVNGHYKVFYAKCSSCASELDYTLDEVKEEKIGEFVKVKHKYIICPICGQKVDAYLWTKEDHERFPPTIPYYPVSGECFLQDTESDSSDV